MTTVRQLSSPAFWEEGEVGLLWHWSHLFVIVWCVAPYLDKIVWHYLVGSC